VGNPPPCLGSPIRSFLSLFPAACVSADDLSSMGCADRAAANREWTALGPGFSRPSLGNHWTPNAPAFLIAGNAIQRRDRALEITNCDIQSDHPHGPAPPAGAPFPSLGGSFSALCRFYA